MGARRGKGSRKAQLERQRFRRDIRTRRSGFRSTRPVLVIVSDDSTTAPRYFQLLSRLLRQRITIHVEGSPCDQSTPAKVVDRAIEARKAKLGKQEENEKKRDAVWALIDDECNSNHEKRIADAEKRATEKGVIVIRSHPCYEVWTLLHINETGEWFDDCAKVCARVAELWKREYSEDFEKSNANYSRIIDRRHAAAERARRNYERPQRDPSWTQVYAVIDHIESILHDNAMST